MADMDRGLLHRIDLLVVGLEFCCICCYYFVGYYRCFVVGRLILESVDASNRSCGRFVVAVAVFAFYYYLLMDFHTRCRRMNQAPNRL